MWHRSDAALSLPAYALSLSRTLSVSVFVRLFSLLIFSYASCFIQLVIYRLFSNFPSHSFQFSFDSWFYWNKYEDLLYTRCLPICLCTHIWAKRCFFWYSNRFFFGYPLPLSKCCLTFSFCLKFSFRSFTDSPNYFSAVTSELSSLSLSLRLSTSYYMYFLIVSISCSVRCFLCRFLFKQHTEAYTRARSLQDGYSLENQFQTNLVASFWFCVYVLCGIFV